MSGVSHLVLCSGIDLDMLDSTLQFLPAHLLRRSRWLVMHPDANRLGALSELWKHETELIACISPENCPLEAMEILLENEQRENEISVFMLYELQDSSEWAADSRNAPETIWVEMHATSRGLASRIEAIVGRLKC